MKRVFGYLRVSGKGQLDGDGFDRQRETIEKFCATKGFFIPAGGWFEEKAVSGTVEHGDRPAFTEMLSRMGPGTADTFIVERADRLARDLMVSELLIEEARKSNVVIFEAASDTCLTNSDDPTRVMIRQMLGVLAQWEKNNLVRKLRAARERIRLDKGKCEGRKSWEDESPENLKLASKIVTWIEVGVQGYQEGPRKNTFAGIARYLTNQNLPSPGGLDKKWSRSNVFDVYHRMIEKSQRPKPNPNGCDKRLLPTGFGDLIMPQS